MAGSRLLVVGAHSLHTHSSKMAEFATNQCPRVTCAHAEEVCCGLREQGLGHGLRVRVGWTVPAPALVQSCRVSVRFMPCPLV